MPIRFAHLCLAACIALTAREGTRAHSAEVRVALHRDGQLEVNGKPASLDELAEALDQAAARPDSSVAYYREGGDADLSPRAEKAMKAVLGSILDHKLPVRLSSKPNFSDSIDDNGQSHTP